VFCGHAAAHDNNVACAAFVSAGDTVTVTSKVRNTGNVMAVISGPLRGRGGDLDCPETVVAPGGNVTYTNSGITVTQGDIDGGSITVYVNTVATPTAEGVAVAVAVTPQPLSVAASDELAFSVEVKIVSGNNFKKAGAVSSESIMVMLPPLRRT
jgi:hypothetical protein